jgi:fluoroquinolone resistance protein
MDRVLIEEKTFEKINFTTNPLAKGEYEYCRFINCDFSNANIANIKFLECTFTDCNLSLSKLTNTTFRDVTFKDNKMLGLHFDTCNEFGLSFSFENCNLNHASFYQTKLKKTTFCNTQLHEVDFTECDLTGSVFDNCDLRGATFGRTIIEKCDFRTSFHYSIDPENNKIKKAKFSLTGIAGLLDKYGIEIDLIN